MARNKNRVRLGFESLEPRHLLSGVAAADAATVSVHIPDNLTAPPAGQIVAPVDVDNAAGIRGAEIHINYDKALLSTSDAGVQAGSLWPQGTQVVANVNDAAGTIVAFVFAADALPAASGSLLQVQFSIKSIAPVDGTTAVDLAGVRLNEGAIVPNPAPQPGPDSTDGKISFVSPAETGTVSGAVYADTNNNHRHDPYEAVPHVKIVLVRSDNGARQETFTGDDGRYEFANLAAGAYQVQEQQPAALLDGGPNSISVNLARGQSLADQNFRELGLRPLFVPNRLFTTLAMPVGSANWASAVRRAVAAGGTEASSENVTAQAAVRRAVPKTSAVHAAPAAVVAAHRLVSSVAVPKAAAAQTASYPAVLSSQSERRQAVDRILASSRAWLLGG
jgi:hypothetical protein